jgi:hypothetical protein
MNKRFEPLDSFRGSAILVDFFFLSGFVFVHGYGFKDKLNFKAFMKASFFRLGVKNKRL